MNSPVEPPHVQPFLASDVMFVVFVMFAVVYAFLFWRERDRSMGWFSVAWFFAGIFFWSTPFQPSGVALVWSPWSYSSVCTFFFLSMGLVEYLDVPAVHRRRVLTWLWITLAAVLVPLHFSLLGIAIKRSVANLPLVFLYAELGALAWWAGRREPGAAHQLVALSLWCIPLLTIALALVRIDAPLLRYYGGFPVLLLALTLLTVSLLRKRRSLELEVVRRSDAETALMDLNATLEARVEVRTGELAQSNDRLVRTIEQLEQTQQVLVQSEKLAALGAMVAGVSHELNTPLGTARLILSTQADEFSKIAEDIATGKLSRSNLEQFLVRSQEMTEIAARAINTSVNLVSSFKQVARDQVSEQRREFDLAQVIHENIDSLRPRFKSEPWIFDVDVPSGINMDSFPGPLGQVLLNLIINSVRHGFEGRDHGRIMITASLDQANVTLRVADDGIGILPEHLGRVFDPFFTTKLGRGGSGIGLNVSHRIVYKVLGGSMHVDSIPGQGARFTLDLPLVAKESF
jgi:signal transduction histidine kinase